MAKFRTRHEELTEFIKLYTHLNNPEIIVEKQTPSFDTVEKFVLEEIKTLSTSMIYSSIKHPCIAFAYDIAMPLFEFDRKLFTAIFAKAVSENYLEVGFDRIFKIICGFNSIEMTIVGCRAAYDAIKDNLDQTNTDCREKYNRLSVELQKFSNSECDGLADDVKIELNSLLSSLGK